MKIDLEYIRRAVPNITWEELQEKKTTELHYVINKPLQFDDWYPQGTAFGCNHQWLTEEETIDLFHKYYTIEFNNEFVNKL